jgi:glycosyltransferase involved in cell wall biosynthesis
VSRPDGRIRVAAFTRYDSQAASTRQRVLQYVPHLTAAGIEVDYRPLLPNAHVERLATGKGSARLATAAAYLRRLRELGATGDCDLIWVYAELFPYLPGPFERLALLSGKPVVYDFDDAFFHTYDLHPRPAVRRVLGQKLEPLLRGAAACCCGNEYLRDYAARLCKRTMILPTVVDTAQYVPGDRLGSPDAPVIIGWIGSPSTWRFVRPLLPLLRSFTESGRARIRIVGAGAAAEADRFNGLELADWSEEREIAEVQAMDIGIMPVPDEPWARGKSGYKLIQYMACGLPVIASPVGVNREIVLPGSSGYLAAGLDEWRQALQRLVDDGETRRAFGRKGRALAEDRYSLHRHAPRLIELFRSLVPAVRKGF